MAPLSMGIGRRGLGLAEVPEEAGTQSQSTLAEVVQNPGELPVAQFRTLPSPHINQPYYTGRSLEFYGC